MDEDVVKKFKTIISQQIMLQGQLKKVNEQMFAAIANKKLAQIKTVSEEIDITIGKMDALERDRVELLVPYIKDKNRLKHISAFIDDFPPQEIPTIKKLHRDLKEKSMSNVEQTKINQILLNEAVLDIRKNVEIISSHVNKPIKYGFDGEKQAALPVHLVNQRI